MRLYSFQNETAYKTLCDKGVLRSHGQLLDPSFKYAYEWLSRQMSKRIGPAPKGVHYPMWAWFKKDGKVGLPDLRKNRHQGWKGQNMYLLTFEVPERLVLLSDFDLWHYVLMGFMVPLTPEERSSQVIDVEETWTRIFDLGNVNEFNSLGEDTQASLWEFKKEWLVGVKRFVSRG